MRQSTALYEECPFCTKGMNASTRAAFTCQYCNQTCCMECIKKTIHVDAAQKVKPRCPWPECRKQFTDPIVASTFTGAFKRKTLERTSETARGSRGGGARPA